MAVTERGGAKAEAEMEKVINTGRITVSVIG